MVPPDCEKRMSMVPPDSDRWLRMVPPDCEKKLRMVPPNSKRGMRMVPPDCEKGMRMVPPDCEKGMRMVPPDSERGMRMVPPNCEKGMRMVPPDSERGMRMVPPDCVDVTLCLCYCDSVGVNVSLWVLMCLCVCVDVSLCQCLSVLMRLCVNMILTFTFTFLAFGRRSYPERCVNMILTFTFTFLAFGRHSYPERRVDVLMCLCVNVTVVDVSLKVLMCLWSLCLSQASLGKSSPSRQTQKPFKHNMLKVPGLLAASFGLQLFLCSFFRPVEGGKVLVMPVDGSHWLSMKILVKELSRRGHEMVVLVPETSILIQGSEMYTSRSFKVPYTKADLDSSMDMLRESIMRAPEFSDLFENIIGLLSFTNMQVKGCESLLYDEALMQELREERFDLMLTDPFLPCGPIISEAFSLPAVYFLRGLPCGLDLEATQCPSPPSYVPRFFTDNTDVMTFPQRVKNVLMAGIEGIICKVLYASFDKLTSRYLKKDVSYREILGHAAIWLHRFDFSFEYPRPVMPNMVRIGGINCAKRKPLPEDLEEFVEGSGDHGFIVFTLGSFVSELPESKTREFFNAFRQIPQRVLWRYTGVFPKDVPENVKLLKWLPQNDLLAHPKVKVFITHGGSHGIYEGICNGVPMVMIPLFGDQRDNVHRMVVRGVAESLTMYDLTTEKLLVALRKVLNDKSYREKITELSLVHKDCPIEPLDLAVFWSEFVMRHGGAEHLRPAAHNLNWVQYHSLDVIGFLLLVLAVVIFISIKTCTFCFRKCFRRTPKSKEE
ncbi:hypothetical protein QTP86_009403 [Hemibagrus guttatus]|nr:hypothetical protein QTP86_009403 [Hemibagrus guttatus]